MATPYVTIVRNVVPSTQDLAADELDSSKRPVLVIAREQTAGRGRTGNEWWQAPSAVAASLAFVAGTVLVDETFPLSVGLAVREAIRVTTGVNVDLKWPNDIELDGLKVGGILVESDDRRVVAGCGLNLWWPDPPAGAGGLLGLEPRSDLGQRVSEQWATTILDPTMSWDRDSYVDVCSTIGAGVTWEPDGAGKVLAIDERGGLVVETERGEVTLRSGDVRMVRSSGDA